MMDGMMNGGGCVGPFILSFSIHPSFGTVRKPAKRPSSNLGVCGFDSRLCHLLLSLA